MWVEFGNQLGTDFTAKIIVGKPPRAQFFRFITSSSASNMLPGSKDLMRGRPKMPQPPGVGMKDSLSLFFPQDFLYHLWLSRGEKKVRSFVLSFYVGHGLIHLCVVVTGFVRAPPLEVTLRGSTVAWLLKACLLQVSLQEVLAASSRVATHGEMLLGGTQINIIFLLSHLDVSFKQLQQLITIFQLK